MIAIDGRSFANARSCDGEALSDRFPVVQRLTPQPVEWG